MQKVVLGWFTCENPSQAKYKVKKLTFFYGYYTNKYPGTYFLADIRCILHAVVFNTWWCVKLEISISKEIATMKSSTVLPEPPAQTLLSWFCKLSSFSTQTLACGQTCTSQDTISFTNKKKKRKQKLYFLLPLLALFCICAMCKP